MFMVHKDNEIEELSDPAWIADLAFLVDITHELNLLNVKLQVRGQLITSMFDHVRGFETKLLLWERQVRSGNYYHFPCCKSIKDTNANAVMNDELYATKIKQLHSEFQRRFSDFRSNDCLFKLFSLPFSVSVDDAPAEMQIELIDLQCNEKLKMKFGQVSLQVFYKSLPPHSFPVLRSHAATMLCLFGSSYLCEQAFSSMKIAKSNLRSRLTSEHLDATMRVALSQQIRPNISVLVASKQCQKSHESK